MVTIQPPPNRPNRPNPPRSARPNTASTPPNRPNQLDLARASVTLADPPSSRANQPPSTPFTPLPSGHAPVLLQKGETSTTAPSDESAFASSDGLEAHPAGLVKWPASYWIEALKARGLQTRARRPGKGRRRWLEHASLAWAQLVNGTY
eukprot:1181610-Prorocentrum_minimum.AAC.1